MADRRIIAISAIFLVLTATTLVPASERAEQPTAVATAYTPSESFVHFFRAINQERLHDAERMMAHFPGVDPDHYRRELERIGHAMAGGYRPMLVGSMQVDGCAVVVFEDDLSRRSSVDLDPAYFIYRNGRWMIMPEVTRFAGQWDDLTTAQAEDLEALRQWFKDSKRSLSTVVDQSRRRRQQRVRSGR